MRPCKTAVALGSSVALLVILVTGFPHAAACPANAAEPLKQPIYTIWGNYTRIYNETEASSLVGFTVHFPRTDNGYSLQMAMVKPMSKHKYGEVYFFFSKTPISSTTTLQDFYKVGVIATESKSGTLG